MDNTIENDNSSQEQDEYAALGEYADESSTVSRSVLKFKQGIYVLAQEQAELPIGTRAIVDPLSLTKEWVKWKDLRPLLRISARVAKGEKLPGRAELGEFDDSTWEQDDNGKPRDPWQEMHSIVLTRTDNGEEYLFVTNTAGGKNAIADLAAKTTVEFRATRRSVLPLIELYATSYYNETYGVDVHVPEFRVIEWKTKEEVVQLRDRDRAAIPQNAIDDLDDGIPF